MVASGQRVEFLPVLSMYQLAQPPVFHTVPLSRRELDLIIDHLGAEAPRPVDISRALLLRQRLINIRWSVQKGRVKL